MQAFFGHVHQNVDVIELHNIIIVLPPDFINYFLIIFVLDLDISS